MTDRRPPRPPVDSIEGEWDVIPDHGYDPGQFYVTSSDTKGHDCVGSFKLPPRVHAVAHEIAQSRDFPRCRSFADVLRDSLVHRFHHLGELKRNGRLLHVANMECVQAVIDQGRIDDERNAATLEAAKQRLYQLAEAKRWGDANDLLDSLRKAQETFSLADMAWITAIQDLIDKYDYSRRRLAIRSID